MLLKEGFELLFVVWERVFPDGDNILQRERESAHVGLSTGKPGS